MVSIFFLQVILMYFAFFSYLDSVISVMEASQKYNTIQLSYKIEVVAGKEDCFYQYVMPQSNLYVNLRVLKGGDGKAGLGIKEPNGTFVIPYEWNQDASYNTENAIGGYYGLCINNEVERFTSKLASVYLHNHILEDFMRYHEEFEKLEISVANFSKPLTQVDMNIGLVLQHLQHARNREAEDYELLQENKFYISFWSIF